MEDRKRLQGLPAWEPSPGKFPGMPPREDARTPLFCLEVYSNKEDDYEQDIYFVNNSTEVLACVSTGSSGMQTCDDEVMPVAGAGYSYRDVLPKERVQVEKYHIINDSDYLLSLDINISSEKYGELQLRELCKGGFTGRVLLWLENVDSAKV